VSGLNARRTLRAVAVLAVLSGCSPLALVGQWVEAPGRGWISVATYHQNTREFFDTRKTQRSFLGEGHAVTTSTFLTAAAGLPGDVDIWAQVSFHHLQFDDVAGDRTSTGFGDSRVWLRVAPLRWLGSEFPFAIRGGVKLPAGDFDVDAEVIPLGDGQRDWEVMAEVGRSFYPRSIYTQAWVGYRWRELNVESRKDFGSELFFFAALGGQFRRLGYKFEIEGWDGRSGIVEGIMVPSFQRDMMQVTPSILVPMGPGQWDFGVRLALGGRNLPAGPAFRLGYFTALNWF